MLIEVQGQPNSLLTVRRWLSTTFICSTMNREIEIAGDRAMQKVMKNVCCLTCVSLLSTKVSKAAPSFAVPGELVPKINPMLGQTGHRVMKMQLSQCIAGDEFEARTSQRRQKTATGEKQVVRDGLMNYNASLEKPVFNMKKAVKSRMLRSSASSCFDAQTESP